MCPVTKDVQYSLADNKDASDTEYEAVTCQACTKVHLINRKTGMLLGSVDGSALDGET